jgi:DNA-binding IclR family transcriptional regulator
MSVLALFSAERGEWTVEEAAEALRVPVSTAYRYFKSLAKSQLIMSYWSGSYVLGPAIIEYDRAMRLHDPLISASRLVMRDLTVTVGGDTVAMLARAYKDKVMCVHHVRAPGALISGYERGRPMPLDRGAASKAILANVAPRQLRSLTVNDGQPGRVRMSAELRSELRLIRSVGYSITRGEVDQGVVGLSVPLFRSTQAIEGSLSLVVRPDRSGEEDQLIAALIRARELIEANLAILEGRRQIGE